MKKSKKNVSDKVLESVIHDTLVSTFLKSLPAEVKKRKMQILKALKNK